MEEERERFYFHRDVIHATKKKYLEKHLPRSRLQSRSIKKIISIIIIIISIMDMQK